MDMKTISGVITKRNEKPGEHGVRVVFTVGPAADRCFVSYFKNDRYLDDETLDVLNGIKEGQEVEFHCAVNMVAGREYLNAKGVTLVERVDRDTVPPQEAKTEPSPASNRLDAGEPKESKNRSYALSYSKDLSVAILGKTLPEGGVDLEVLDRIKRWMFATAEEMVMFLDGLPRNGE